MAFGSTVKTSTPKALGNIDKDDLNSNQQAVPVPYIAGRNRIPVTWITPCYNRQAKKVSSGSSKGSSASAQYKYQVDIVTAICVCGHTPLDAISLIIINHVVVWYGNVTRRAGHPYETITIPKYGQARIYWGQQDQPVQDMFTCVFNATVADDTFDAQPTRVDNLPPYRGIALLVLQGFQLGSSTQMPVVEVVVDRAPLWITGQTAPVVDARGSNVIALLYEWMVDDWFGVGLDPSALVTADWLATYAAAEAAGHHISPIITDQTGFRQIVAQLLEYFDGWVRRNGAQLSVGFWRHGNTDTSNLPKLDDTAMVGEPQLKSSGYGDTINQANIGFRDNAAFYNDDSWPANSPANLRIVGERRVESVSRPWIVTPEHAAAYGAEYINLYSQPHYTGPAKAKREWVAQNGIGPGSLIKLDSGTLLEEIVCRVTAASWSADRDGSIDLTLDSERGLYPSLYYPTPPPGVGDFVVVAALIEQVLVITLPSGLKNGSDVQLSVLAERPDPTLTGFRVYLSRDNQTYDPLVTDVAFAVRGTVATPYAPASAALDPTGITVQLDGVDADLVVAQSDAARDANTLLLFVDGEIMSVGDVVALGNGQYQLAVKRALYGTAQAAHFQNAVVWLQFRAELAVLDAPGTIEKGQTVYLKLPTHNASDDQALSDAAMVEYTVGLQSAVGAAFGLTLSTYANAATDGTVESYVKATWVNYADQGIDLHDVALKRADQDDSAWIYRTLSDPLAIWEVTPLTAYEIKIRSVNDLGEPSDWSAVQSITSASISPFAVTGLGLVGKANGTINEEPDFHFAWRLNSPARVGSIGGTNGKPLAAGLQDPRFAFYLIQVLDPTTGAVVKQDKVTTPGYVFTESMNSLAFGGSPRNAILFQVAAVDNTGAASAWVQVAVSNPPPPRPAYLNGDGFYGGVVWQWGFTAAPDLAGGRFRVNTSNDFASATEYDVGNATSKTSTAAAAGAVYAWVCEYDTFGSESAWLGPVEVLAGTVAASDVQGLDVRLSQQYPNTVILEGVVWGNNTPAAGSIAWTCPSTPCVTWQGKQYVIASGSTALQYIWWKAGENSFRVSDTNPETDPTIAWDPLTCFQIATNYQHGGVAVVVWQFAPNLTVGSLYVLAAAIQKGIFGQLIANTVDIIGTLQLQGQAVTLPVGARGADATYADWTTVVSVTVPSTGAPAFIFASWGNSWPSTSFTATAAYWRIVRSDGVTIDSDDYSSLPGTFPLNVDTLDAQTLAGNATYSLQLRRVGTDGTTPATTTARSPKLLYLETKR